MQPTKAGFLVLVFQEGTIKEQTLIQEKDWKKCEGTCFGCIYVRSMYSPQVMEGNVSLALY